MPQLPDLVVDTKLRTDFHGSAIIHSFLEIDHGKRISRKEYWKLEQPVGQDGVLGRGSFGQVRLQRCIAGSTKQGTLRAVKEIRKQSDSTGSLDYNRELEAIAKFSADRVC
jgi:hypothetical protein